MLFHPADLQSQHIVSSRDSPDISPDSRLEIRLYTRGSVLCAEYDVIIECSVGVCHILASLLRSDRRFDMRESGSRDRALTYYSRRLMARWSIVATRRERFGLELNL